jgi:hypothetical protein
MTVYIFSEIPISTDWVWEQELGKVVTFNGTALVCVVNHYSPQPLQATLSAAYLRHGYRSAC